MAALIINNPPPIPRQFAAPSVGYMLGEQSMSDRYTPAPEGPKVDDIHVQSSTYGAPIPIVYGGFKVAGNLIWATDLIPGMTKKWTDYKTKTVYPSVPTYLCSFAVSLVGVEIYAVRKIWADGKLMYDRSKANKGIKSIFRVDGIKVYRGTEDQMPDPLIEKDKGVGNVPAFRGMSYVVFNRLELLKFGNRIPNLVFEVITKGMAEYEPPEILGRGRDIAVDPATGYLWCPGNYKPDGDPLFYYSGGDAVVRIYDPVNKVLVDMITLPYIPLQIDPFIGNGVTQPIYPDYILYNPVSDTMYVSGGSGLTAMGYTIDVKTKIPVQSMTMSSHFFWPGPGIYMELPPTSDQVALMSQNGIAWGIGAILDKNATYLSSYMGPENGIGWVFFEAHSDDYSHQTYFGYGYGIVVDGVTYDQPWVFMQEGSAVWDELGQRFWYSSPYHAELICFDIETKQFKLMYTFRHSDFYPEVYKNLPPDRDGFVIGLSGMFFSPDTNQLYMQQNDLTGLTGSTNVATFAVGADTITPTGEIYPGNHRSRNDPLVTGGVMIGGNNKYVYLGDETWAVEDFGYVLLMKFRGAVEGAPVLLKEIVGDVSDRVKLPAVRYDVEQLIDVVDGYGITSTTSGRAVVESLMPYYFFDSVESDGKVKFVKRGQTPKLSISSADTIDNH